MVEIRHGGTARPGELSDGGGTYSFSWPAVQDRQTLLGSLARHGVMRPLLCLVDGGAGLKVVSGARRLAWAAETGVARIPIAVVEDGSAQDLWDHLLAEAQDHRPLNPVEVGRYLSHRMAHTGETAEDLETEVLPALGLPPRAAAAEDALWVSKLPPGHRDGFADGSRPLHAARLLRSASRADALTVLELTDGLAGGINKFTELARTLLECAWRDGETLEQWLAGQGLSKAWERLEDLREQVRLRRYPHLSRWEEAFPGAIAGAGLPPLVGIHAPRGFEGGRYQCRVTFSSLGELHLGLETTLQRLKEGRLAALQEFLD